MRKIYPENLLSISRFADRFGKSRPTVYKMIESGQLTMVWIGKRKFVDISDPKRVREALLSLPGIDNYSGRSYSAKQKKRKLSADTEFDLAYQEYEAEQEAKKLKSRQMRLKRKTQL